MSVEKRSRNPTVRAFRKDIRSLERQIELSLASQTDCCGVTPAQCHLLLEVADQSDPSVGELAGALELDASTLSRSVDGLVKLGFLERREDAENRRRYLVRLTAKGRKKVDEIDGACDAYYEGFLKGLPAKERTILVDSLPRLVEAFRAWRTVAKGAECCATRVKER
ncbi:MAG TPA: MarR family transcriptional regulator [Treponemataceae bacterium]|nr:MarR family transcriptional regulator [Treponemataceae bacterium]